MCLFFLLNFDGTDGEVGGVDDATQILDEELEGPAAKKPRTEE